VLLQLAIREQSHAEDRQAPRPRRAALQAKEQALADLQPVRGALRVLRHSVGFGAMRRFGISLNPISSTRTIAARRRSGWLAAARHRLDAHVHDRAAGNVVDDDREVRRVVDRLQVGVVGADAGRDDHFELGGFVLALVVEVARNFYWWRGDAGRMPPFWGTCVNGAGLLF
jgi:hypothetical protein